VRLPGVCIDCRQPVTWTGWQWVDGSERQRDRKHECRAASGAKVHDVRVGVSDTPPYETARLPLTPVVAEPSHLPRGVSTP
jgi:hypothetical protein